MKVKVKKVETYTVYVNKEIEVDVPEGNDVNEFVSEHLENEGSDDMMDAERDEVWSEQNTEYFIDGDEVSI